jgi:hypothetical protein
VLGYGACVCFTCSECGFESLTPLEVEDVKDGEHGPKAYRPCAECNGSEDVAMPTEISPDAAA